MDAGYDDRPSISSKPGSIYHTGFPQPLPKEAHSIYRHAIYGVWRELGVKIFKYFDSIGLKWTSINPAIRFVADGQEPSPPFILVGVLPGTLTADDAKAPAAHCKELLSEYGITDVEIAFREFAPTRRFGL